MLSRLFITLLIIGAGAAPARTYMAEKNSLVPKAAQSCLPEALKDLPSPQGGHAGTATCVTQVWLDGVAPTAARDFYQAYLQKARWDVANPFNEGDRHFRFTAAKKKVLAQFEFFALERSGGTRLEISFSPPYAPRK